MPLAILSVNSQEEFQALFHFTKWLRPVLTSSLNRGPCWGFVFVERRPEGLYIVCPPSYGNWWSRLEWNSSLCRLEAKLPRDPEGITLLLDTDGLRRATEKQESRFRSLESLLQKAGQLPLFVGGVV